jgi:hypothetical protein
MDSDSNESDAPPTSARLYERRSETMDSNMILQTVIWIFAGAALVMLMMRRKNRKVSR